MNSYSSQIKNIDEHGNDVAETHDNTHKEECFDQAYQHHDDQHYLWDQAPGIMEILQIYIGKPEHEVSHIDVVPRIRQILSTLFASLCSVIKGGVQEANENNAEISCANFWALFTVNDSSVF